MSQQLVVTHLLVTTTTLNYEIKRFTEDKFCSKGSSKYWHVAIILLQVNLYSCEKEDTPSIKF